MKNLKFIQSAFFALLIVLSIGACKDACKDSPCLNGATCTDVDGEAVCDCAAGYEGEFCATEMRTKFIGSYDASGICSQPSSSNSYVCNVLATSSNILEIEFDNFGNIDAGGATNNLIAKVTSPDSIIIDLQTIFSPNGDIDYEGSGYWASEGMLIIDYNTISPFSNQPCRDTFSIQ